MDSIINLINIDKALNSLISNGNWNQEKSELLSIEIEKLDIYIKKIKLFKPTNPNLLGNKPDFNYLQRIWFYCFSYFLSPHINPSISFLESKKKALRISWLIFELLWDWIFEIEKQSIKNKYYFYSVISYHWWTHVSTACTLAKRIMKSDSFLMEDIFIRLLALDFKWIYRDRSKYLVSSDSEQIQFYKKNVISFSKIMLYWNINNIESILNELKSIEHLNFGISSHEVFLISKTIEFLGIITPNSIWSILPRLGFRHDYLKILSLKDKNNIYLLWESQKEIIETSWFWDKKRVHINLPTSWWKTLLSELLIYKTLLEGKKCIYIVPKNSLLNEIEDAFFKRFRFLNKKVSSSIWYNSTFLWYEIDSDILVLTQEKLDLMIRNNQEILSDIGIFIFDEFHTIENKNRWILLETLIAYLMHIQHEYAYKIITMSAVLDDISKLSLWFWDDWIFARSTYVPVRKTYALIEQIHSNTERKKFHLKFYYRKWLQKINVDVFEDIRLKPRWTKIDLALLMLSKINTLLPDKKILLYFHRKESIESFIKKYIIENPEITESSKSYQQLNSLLNLLQSKIWDEHLIYKALQRWIWFHTADLPTDIRKEIEFAYKNNYINTLVSTTSLAEWVNLPISVIIMWEIWTRSNRLPIADFRNIIWRTWRAFVDTEWMIFLTNYKQTWGGVEWYIENNTSVQLESSIDISLLISSLEEDEYDIIELSRVQIFIFSIYQQLLNSTLGPDYSTIKEIINRMPMMSSINDEHRELFHNKYTHKIYNNAKDLNDLGKLSIYNQTWLSAKSNYQLLLIVERIQIDINNFEFDTIDLLSADEIVAIPDIFILDRFNELISIPEFKPSLNFEDIEVHYNLWLDWVSWMSFSDLRDRYFQSFANPTSVASKYIAEVFEYRLPWALWIIFNQLPTIQNIFIKELVESLSIRTRYGVKDWIAVKLIQLWIEDRYLINELKKSFELYNETVTRIDSITDWLRDISFSFLERQMPILKNENSLVRRLSRIKSWLRIKTTLLEDDGALTFSVSWIFRGKYNDRLWDVYNNELLSLHTEDNSYDPFAVRIDYNEKKLGYIPSKYAEEISEYVEWERDLSLAIFDIRDNEILLTVSINR